MKKAAVIRGFGRALKKFEKIKKRACIFVRDSL